MNKKTILASILVGAAAIFSTTLSLPAEARGNNAALNALAVQDYMMVQQQQASVQQALLLQQQAALAQQANWAQYANPYVTNVTTYNPYVNYSRPWVASVPVPVRTFNHFDRHFNHYDWRR